MVIESALTDAYGSGIDMFAEQIYVAPRVKAFRIVRMNPRRVPHIPRGLARDIPRSTSGAEDIRSAASTVAPNATRNSLLVAVRMPRWKRRSGSE